jgi:RNA polymerase sigma-70 factor (ECF subfamily)
MDRMEIVRPAAAGLAEDGVSVNAAGISGPAGVRKKIASKHGWRADILRGTGQRPLDPNNPDLLRPRADNAGETQNDVEARIDAGLLQAIAGGDERALAALYHRRGGLVFSFLARMLGHEGEAREALQDTFIRLWRRAKEFDARRSSATAWLLLFARGLALDRLRARARHAAKLSAYEREVAVLEAGPSGGGQGGTPPDELAGACRDALKKLPADQGRALELAFFRGWTHEEIAAAQGEALGTVKARIRRGLLALRKTMKDYYG